MKVISKTRALQNILALLLILAAVISYSTQLQVDIATILGLLGTTILTIKPLEKAVDKVRISHYFLYVKEYAVYLIIIFFSTSFILLFSNSFEISELDILPLARNVLLLLFAAMFSASIYGLFKITAKNATNKQFILQNNKNRKKIEMLIAEQIAADKFHYLVFLQKNVAYIMVHENTIEGETARAVLTKMDLPNTTWDDKVKQFRRYAKKMVMISQRYDNNMDNELEQGNIFRLVFDVKYGGVFYGKIYQDNLEKESGYHRTYIFGATMYQNRMDKCTREMGLLIDNIRLLDGLIPIIYTEEVQNI